MAANAAALTPALQGRVEALNHDGWGVIRSGKVVFVAGALPGEDIEYRIRRRQRGHDEGELLRVISPSPERVQPRCAHFGQCGGCALQHLSSDSQLRIKDDMLRETLRRVGKVEPQHWLPPLAGDPWGYRRRARLGARYVFAKGRSLVGFRERLSSHVAALNRCEVLTPGVGAMLAELSALVTSLSIPERIPQVEVAVGDAATVLVLRILSPITAEDRAKLAAFGEQHRVHWLLQPGGPDSLESLDGPAPQLYYDLPSADVRLNFEPADFIQVNGDMNRRLVDRVIELLDIGARDAVLDLYCGLGNFTLPIARRAAQAFGIEGEAGLVARAAANAVFNGIGNARFAAADLSGPEAAQRCVTLARQQRESWSQVLLDPPRVGAADVLQAVAQLAPRRVVYVSCNPASLARDLGILVTAHGFTLREAGIVDMFPHTSHVESVAVLDGPEKRKR
ncbi:MAG: 23S rRNA (uracil(1939)-C(5))-methyltransferase RlmD [Nevskiaceae bacterium]|jgi:23S rRNA (uracil1939-C5)-methyltransferase|nr:23S rRNA (uracil(1939)-C(5))-methyltransferase RlmD [Nevskiaceae bacterium]